MSFPVEPIQELSVGSRPTFLEADFANKIIRAINILGNIQIDQTIPGGKVIYDDEKVTLKWKDISDQSYTGTIKILDANDLSKQWVIEIDHGSIPKVTYEDSLYEFKTVEICESGSAVSYEFLIKS